MNKKWNSKVYVYVMELARVGALLLCPRAACVLTAKVTPCFLYCILRNQLPCANKDRYGVIHIVCFERRFKDRFIEEVCRSRFQLAEDATIKGLPRSGLSGRDEGESNII